MSGENDPPSDVGGGAVRGLKEALEAAAEDRLAPEVVRSLASNAHTDDERAAVEAFFLAEIDAVLARLDKGVAAEREALARLARRVSTPAG